MTSTTTLTETAPMVSEVSAPVGEDGELAETYPARPLADVLDDVVAHNKRFVHHAHESTHWLMALWVASTHGLDRWDWHGRIYIHAPQPGVGKTVQAKVIERLTPDPLHIVGTSAPGLFRAIDDGRPTVFLDEADNQFSGGGKDKADVTAVINGGYEPGNYVVRSVNGVGRRYETYTAMCIIGIDNGTLPEATQTRCIPVRMTPLPTGAHVERYRHREHDNLGDEVRWQLASHAMDYVIVPTPLQMRQADLWEALYSVAHAASGDWPTRVQVAAERHQWTHDVPETKRFLVSVKDWFDANPGQSRVQSSVLAAHVSAYDDLPAMAGKGVAQRMKVYGVVPRKRSESQYRRADLEPVFEQWL